jgi:hypothetical protein
MGHHGLFQLKVGWSPAGQLPQDEVATSLYSYKLVGGVMMMETWCRVKLCVYYTVYGICVRMYVYDDGAVYVRLSVKCEAVCRCVHVDEDLWFV